jgi:hypothetical protein
MIVVVKVSTIERCITYRWCLEMRVIGFGISRGFLCQNLSDWIPQGFEADSFGSYDIPSRLQCLLDLSLRRIANLPTKWCILPL